MASIRKRSNGWEVRWRDENQKAQSKSFRVAKEAEVFKREIEIAIIDGRRRRSDVSQMTLADFVYDHWQHTLDVRPGTLATYDMALRHYIMPVFGNTVLSDIDGLEIEKWRIALLKGTPFGRKPLAEKTVERIVNLFASILKKAVKSNRLDQSPFESTRKRGKASARNKSMHLESEQYFYLLKKFTKRNQIILQVMYYSGLRPSEALGLTWDRIDLENKTIKVDRQLSRELASNVFSEPKTTSSIRTVYFGEILKAHLIKHREDFGVGPHGLLTSNRHGAIYTYRAASETFNSLARGLNLAIGSGLHMLRHTYATHAIVNGTNIKFVQQQLGHKSITETMDTYGHLLISDLSAFATKLDDSFRSVEANHVALKRVDSAV